jgi:hypothetical protein
MLLDKSWCETQIVYTTDTKISESPYMTQMAGVSYLQCAYSCFAAGSCCALGYKESIKTCVIDKSFNCCTPSETSNCYSYKASPWFILLHNWEII